MAKNKNNPTPEEQAKQAAKEEAKRIHKEKLKVLNEALEVKIREKDAKKAALKLAKSERKQADKALKLKIKTCRQTYHQQTKEFDPKDLNKEQIAQQQETLKNEYLEQLFSLKNERAQLNFNYGQTHQTLWWKLTKWTFGLRKEFRHIIWSHPKNTFKYLLIIILIVGIFAILFFAIDNIIQLF